jgi:enoyl-CoA hydratase
MSEAMLRLSEERGIHWLTMNSGPNLLDEGLMAALRDCLGKLREGGAPPILIASSHHNLFCPGWDLKRLTTADRPAVATVLGMFNDLILDLFSYPGPTAVAIGGHAVAGGCLLALACDLRIMATGRPRLGLAELNLGVPVPAGALLMLRARLGAATVEEVVLRGDGCAAERARELGLVYRAVTSDEVNGTTDRELRKLASKSSRAYAATKSFLYSGVWERIQAANGDGAAVFLDCWFDDETQRRIADVARSLSHQ